MSTAAKVQIISCVKCGAKNRLDPTRQAVCGRCKTPITADVSPFIVTDQNFAEEVERDAARSSGFLGRMVRALPNGGTRRRTARERA